ncbi:MAG: hypothetical protein IJ068_00315 [Bacilli bacterium]|nr:hypothetical protein [Bacilli bacterium]
MSLKYRSNQIYKLINNKKVKEYLEEHNLYHYIRDDYKYAESGIFDNKIYFLLMILGIPIGAWKPVDSHGNDVFEWTELPDGEVVRDFYTPLNNFDDVKEYAKKNRYIHLIINPIYFTEEQSRHLCYLLEFANDENFFDQLTMNKMQNELIDSAPINYEIAMKIFKKYYTKEIQDKFLSYPKLDKERLFYLSGLKYEEDDIIINDKLQKLNELGFKFRTTKDENEKENLENEVKELLVDLKKTAIAKFKDESDIKKFLDNITFFNNYSFNNHLLIWAQDPDAKYVAARKTYQDMGYSVNKSNDDGIKIFIPKFYNIAKIIDSDNKISYKPYFILTEEEKKKYKDKSDDSITFYRQKLSGFTLGNVFSANDTNMPMDIIDKELNPVLHDNKANDIMNCFIKTIYNDGYKVNFKELDSDTKGYCDHANKTIVVRKGLGNIVQLKVLIHEYAHALAHKHLENNNIEYQNNRNKYETEAESISYVVSNYLGLNTNDFSLSYLYAWSKEKNFEEIDDSFNTIVNFSKRIIKNFQKFYDREFNLNPEVANI